MDDLHLVLSNYVGMRVRPQTTRSAYLAARFDRREELRRHASWLARNDVRVTSRWLFEDHSAASFNEYAAQKLGADDIVDVLAADTLILFTSSLDTHSVPAVWARGGMNVEFGIALLGMKRLVVVGPRTNIFTHQPYVEQYDDFRAFKKDVLSKGRG